MKKLIKKIKSFFVKAAVEPVVQEPVKQVAQTKPAKRSVGKTSTQPKTGQGQKRHNKKRVYNSQVKKK